MLWVNSSDSVQAMEKLSIIMMTNVCWLQDQYLFQLGVANGYNSLLAFDNSPVSAMAKLNKGGPLGKRQRGV